MSGARGSSGRFFKADDAIAVAVAGGVGEGPRVVLLGVLFYRWVSRHARARFSRGGAEDSRRADQLQNSVDTIAVEVERISEGQRYVTKALNEGVQPAVGAPAGQEVLVHRKGT